MDTKLIVSKILRKKTAVALGKDVIVNFQKIVPKLKRLKPSNLLYFIKNFQKREGLSDEQTAILIEKLVDKYNFHKISPDYLNELVSISKKSPYSKELTHLKFYLEHLNSLS